MKYRGQECTSRPFSDSTGTGIEWLLNGQVVIKEHKTRIITPAEQKSIDDTNKAIADAKKRADALETLINAQLAKEA